MEILVGIGILAILIAIAIIQLTVGIIGSRVGKT
jgi:hypothetical protein